MTTPAVLPSVSTPAAVGFHPMDTSRVLLSLMELARDSERQTPASEETDLDWVVSPWTLRRLLSAIHYRDESILQHSRRVALLAVGIARHLGWEERPLRQLEVAALLHDIGKIGIPSHILDKPGRLSPDEQEYVLLHHYIGTDLLQACRIDREIVDVCWHSHTHGRVVAESDLEMSMGVPQGARILAVADAYDSLRNDQAFRRGKSHEETMRILHEQSGKEFDRNVVAALNRWIGRDAMNDEVDSSFGFQWSAPVDAKTIAEAGTLCQVFSFLYLLESLYDGFCIVDADLQFTVWNHGIHKLTGLPAREMTGESWAGKLLNLVDSEKKPLAERDCPVHQVLFTNTLRCGNYKLEHRRSGKWRDVEVQSIPLIGEDNRLQGIAQIYRDVSQVKGNAGQYQELQMAARRDPLTGVGNRGELEAKLGRLFVVRNERKDAPDFSVIFLDLDHFKAINDTHGHAVGDRVLTDLARLVSDELYSGETVCRYGGEEFVILCPDTSLENAIERAERLRRALSETRLGKPANVHVTASFGVAQVERGDTLEKLLHRADQALYDAKRGGRNQTRWRTNDKARNKQPGGSQETSSRTQAFVHRADFLTRVASDIVHYKVTGFVEDMQARLRKVTPERIELEIGQPSFWGGWGKTDDRQPVHITLALGKPSRPSAQGLEQLAVGVTVTPVGTCRNDAVFQLRAARVVQHLRAFLVAESCEPAP